MSKISNQHDNQDGHGQKLFLQSHSGVFRGAWGRLWSVMYLLKSLVSDLPFYGLLTEVLKVLQSTYEGIFIISLDR